MGKWGFLWCLWADGNVGTHLPEFTKSLVMATVGMPPRIQQRRLCLSFQDDIAAGQFYSSSKQRQTHSSSPSLALRAVTGISPSNSLTSSSSAATTSTSSSPATASSSRKNAAFVLYTLT